VLPKAASLTKTLLSSPPSSFSFFSGGYIDAESTFNESATMTTEPSDFASMGKNVNIYWIGATGLAVWFLFIHAPPYFRTHNVLADAPFMFHLIGAYSIYLACVFNTVVTPSIKRSLHVWVGRVGMILGVFGFLSGLYLCYWPWRLNKPSLDFSIGITIGGVAQVLLQARGYLNIKKFQELRDKLTSSSTTNLLAATNESDVLFVPSPENRDRLEQDKLKALTAHIDSMISLFVIACGVPAAIRIVGLFGAGGNATLVGLIVVMTVVSAMYQKAILKRIIR
jgi:hypothetical protein